MKTILFGLFLAISTISFGCESKTPTEKNIPLNAFTSIEISRGIEVNLVKGSSWEAIVSTDADFQQHVKVNQFGKNLDLTVNYSGNKGHNVKVTIMVPANELESIECEQGSSIQFDMPSTSDHLDITLEQASKAVLMVKSKTIDIECEQASTIVLSGSTEKVKANIEQASQMDMTDCIVNTAVIKAKQASHVKTGSVEVLEAREVRQASSVSYKKSTSKVIKGEIGPASSLRSR